MCVCERERWNQVCVCVCLCVMESGMCVYDRIKCVCVREREMESGVCVFVWHGIKYVCVCVWERDRIKCTHCLAENGTSPDMTMAEDEPRLVCWVSPRRRQSSSSGGTQLLHGAYVHSESKELSWIRIESEWLHGGFVFPSRHASSWALGHLCVQTKLGKFRAASWGIVPCFSSHSQKTSWT